LGQLLTVSETADLLRFSTSTVYRMVGDGRIPSIKLGTSIRFREKDLQDFLSKRMRKTSTRESNQQNKLTNLHRSPIDRAKGGLRVARQKTRRRYGYGNVRQRRPGGRWTIDFRDECGKRKQKVIRNAQTYDDALLALEGEISDAFSRKYGFREAARKVVFSDFAEKYLEDYAKPNKKSWKSDYYYLKAHLLPHFGKRLLQEIRRSDVEGYKSKRFKEKSKGSTVNRELAVLRKIFNTAIDWDYLKENPVARVTFFSEINNQRTRYLIGEEEANLLSSAREPLRSILVLALNTGMRLGEILALKWSSVDTGKTEIRLTFTKSNKIRVIPINPLVFSELTKLEVTGHHSDYVFLNPKTKRPYVDIGRAFAGACKRAKVKGLRFHDLRHTFASRLIQQGADIITVKDLLGHSSVRMTERYTHSNSELKKKAVDKLADQTLRKPQNGDKCVPEIPATDLLSVH
jgi:excisionase family DNA binding protein